MKLDYTILWIDDRISEHPFLDIREKLLRFLKEEEFFDANIEVLEDLDDLEETVQRSFDLVVTDFNIEGNNSRDGHEVIRSIRSKQIQTEIFFYTAQGGLTTLPELANNNRVTFYNLNEGDYLGLLSNIKELVIETVKKIHHPVVMRGLMMSETSELDFLMKEILHSLIAPPDGSDDSREIVRTKYKSDFLEDKMTKLAEIPIHENVSKLIEFIDASHVWRAVGRNCTDNKAEFAERIKEYDKHIIGPRNKLAHSRLISNEQGMFLENKFKPENPTVFDEQYCRSIRKNLLHYRSVLSGLGEVTKRKE